MACLEWSDQASTLGIFQALLISTGIQYGKQIKPRYPMLLFISIPGTWNNCKTLKHWKCMDLSCWVSDCFLDVLSHLMSFHLTYRFSTSPHSTGNNSSTATLHKLIHILIQWSYCSWNGTKTLAFKNIQQQNLKISQVLSGFSCCAPRHWEP